MAFKALFQKIPFWLKFGIIFTIVLFVILIITLVLLDMQLPVVLLWLFVVVSFPLFELLNRLDIFGVDLILILSPVYYFIIGSILGFIIQLIKSKIKKQ